MDQPTAEVALGRLNVLIGDWTLEATWPNDEFGPSGGSATFEWLPSGAHIVEYGTMGLAEAPDNTSIIGCDGANGTYTQLYTDERGVARIFEMSLDDHEWKLWRVGAPFAQRFTATISDDRNTISGTWEMAEDFENYHVDFDLVYRRVV